MYDRFPTVTLPDTTELIGERKEEKKIMFINHTAIIFIRYTGI
jgi:hypothetical protein